MKFCVYMLQCCDNSFYVGVTNNLEMRLHEHVIGFDEGSYTQERLPVKLVYSEPFRYIRDAIAWEKQIKKWTRKKKEALIQRDIRSIRRLSECQNASHAKNFPIMSAVMVSGDEP